MKRPPNPWPVWTDEEKRRVEKMLLAGMNPTAIGAALNRPRNAICGMIFRNPFLQAAQSERLAKMSHGDRYRFLFRKRSEITSEITSNIPIAATPPQNLKPSAYDAKSLKVRLIDLRANQCKYIPGNDHLSCGYPVHDGSVYCTHHMLRCKTQPHAKGKQRPFGWGS